MRVQEITNQILKELDKKQNQSINIPHRNDYINYYLSNLFAERGIKPSKLLDRDGDGILDIEDCDPDDPEAQGFLSSVKSAVSKAVSSVKSAVSKVVSGTKSTVSKVVSSVTRKSSSTPSTSTSSSKSTSTSSKSSGGGSRSSSSSVSAQLTTGGTYNPNTGVYTDTSGQSYSRATAPAGAIIVGEGTTPLQRVYTGGGSSTKLGSGGGTYDPKTGVYIDASGQGFSTAIVPAGATISPGSTPSNITQQLQGIQTATSRGLYTGSNPTVTNTQIDEFLRLQNVERNKQNEQAAKDYLNYYANQLGLKKGDKLILGKTGEVVGYEKKGVGSRSLEAEKRVYETYQKIVPVKGYVNVSTGEFVQVDSNPGNNILTKAVWKVAYQNPKTGKVFESPRELNEYIKSEPVLRQQTTTIKQPLTVDQFKQALEPTYFQYKTEKPIPPKTAFDYLKTVFKGLAKIPIQAFDAERGVFYVATGQGEHLIVREEDMNKFYKWAKKYLEYEYPYSIQSLKKDYYYDEDVFTTAKLATFGASLLPGGIIPATILGGTLGAEEAWVKGRSPREIAVSAGFGAGSTVLVGGTGKLVTTAFKKGIVQGIASIGGIILNEPISRGVSEGVGAIIPETPTGFAPSGVVPQVGRGLLYTGATLIPGVGTAFMTNLAKNSIVDPQNTVDSLIKYVRENPYEIATLISAEYGIEKYKGRVKTQEGPFTREQQALDQAFQILKREKIDVGRLRLNRLKDLPKDPKTLKIIEKFIKEEGLVVGGTTAIETMKINGKHINLRRIPRDLELYDPLRRSSKKLGQDLYVRLREAGKDVSIDANGAIKFKGIEGHGVNFQKIEAMNLERFRNRIYTNPDGILIADPLSTAYNKVADLLKTKGVKSQKAQQMKVESPEAFEKAVVGEKVYVRYPKDVIGALSTAEQAVELSLKKYKKGGVPILQEYRTLKLGQAKEALKPYLSKLKYEEAPAIPNYYTGPKAGILSGTKYIESAFLDSQKQLLKSKKAQSSVLNPEFGKQISSPYYTPLIPKLSKVSFPTITPPPINFQPIQFEQYDTKVGPSPTYTPTISTPTYISIPTYTSTPTTPYKSSKAPTPEYPPILPLAEYPSMIPPQYPPIEPSKPLTYKSPKYPPKKPPIKEPPKLPRPILPLQEEKEKKERKITPGYNVYGKLIRTNTFKKLNTSPVSRARAMDIGSYYVDQTLARTYKIKGTKNQAQQDFQFLYIPQGYAELVKQKIRPYKIKKKTPYAFEQQYIEKMKRVGDTPAERKQLQQFRNQVKNILK